MLSLTKWEAFLLTKLTASFPDRGADRQAVVRPPFGPSSIQIFSKQVKLWKLSMWFVNLAVKYLVYQKESFVLLSVVIVRKPQYGCLEEVEGNKNVDKCLTSLEFF